MHFCHRRNNTQLRSLLCESVTAVKHVHAYPGERCYNSKPCKNCGKVSSILTERANAKIAGQWVNAFVDAAGLVYAPSPLNSYPVTACACGTPVACKPVRGKLNRSKECNARCIASKGHVCECSCGGKNHGAGNA